MNRPKPSRVCAFFLYAESIGHPDTAQRLFKASVAGPLVLDPMDFVDSVLGLTGDTRERRARYKLTQHSAQDFHQQSDNPQTTPVGGDGPALRADNGSQPGGPLHIRAANPRCRQLGHLGVLLSERCTDGRFFYKFEQAQKQMPATHRTPLRNPPAGRLIGVGRWTFHADVRQNFCSIVA